jgi:hypothetical protein
MVLANSVHDVGASTEAKDAGGGIASLPGHSLLGRAQGGENLQCRKSVWIECDGVLVNPIRTVQRSFEPRLGPSLGG